MDNNKAGFLVAAAYNWVGGRMNILGTVSMPTSSTYTLNFTADEATTNIGIMTGVDTTVDFTVLIASMAKYVTQTVNVPNIVIAVPSKYRFGNDAQEKVDEVAGIGNHYTALFWEYDPRDIRRWNIDSKPNESVGSYTPFGNNPISLTDYYGDTVQLIIGKPYTDRNGEEHPYGHAAIRVYNAKEGYNEVYDFGRYGEVTNLGKNGEGIMNVYKDGDKYLKSEMSQRSSVGYSQATSPAEDKKVMAYYHKLAAEGSVYNGGAVPGGGGTAYKLKDDYDVFNNNCLTKSAEGLGAIGCEWVGDEYKPNEASEIMESRFVQLGLSRTEYNKGGEIKTTYTAPEKKPTQYAKPNLNATVPTQAADKTNVAQPVIPK